MPAPVMHFYSGSPMHFLSGGAALARPPQFVVCSIMCQIRAFRYFWPRWLTFRKTLNRRRACAQGRERHHCRLCRPRHSVLRTHPRLGSRRRTGSHSVPQALHALQRRPVRGSSGQRHAAAGAARRDPILPQAEALIAGPVPISASAATGPSMSQAPTTSRCRRRRLFSSRSTFTGPFVMSWVVMPSAGLCSMARATGGEQPLSHAAVRHNQSASSKASSLSSGRYRPGLVSGVATRDGAFSFIRRSA